MSWPKSLFDPAVRREVEGRIGARTPEAPRPWGRMDAGRMLAHAAAAVETSTGDLEIPRSLPARLPGPFFRGSILGPEPFRRDGPTHPRLVPDGPRDFVRERERLLSPVGA